MGHKPAEKILSEPADGRFDGDWVYFSIPVMGEWWRDGPIGWLPAAVRYGADGKIVETVIARGAPE